MNDSDWDKDSSDSDSSEDTTPVRFTGKRDDSDKTKRRSIFNLNIPGPVPRCIQILNMAEISMISRASIALAVHNRLSDTNRPLASSTGLATVLPIDYFGIVRM